MPDTRTCPISDQTFDISDKEAAHVADFDMPLPNLCPDERLREQMAARNEWKLYPRTCDKTGEQILSAYPSDSPYTVYRNDIWWGDSWEALDYGREFDFDRPFFDQFHELMLAVPREGTSIFNSENCEYNSHIRQSRNCYLNSLIVKCEDVYYCYWMVGDTDMIDTCYSIMGSSSLCFHCTDITDCYECTFVQECVNCTDCAFSFQLSGCDHCLLCTNLSNVSYAILNEQCTKEEYETKRAEILNGSWNTWHDAIKQYLEMKEKTIHRAVHNLNCENVTADHLYHCRNAENSFDADQSEDFAHSISVNDSKNIFSCYSAGWPRCEKLWRCTVSRGCTDMAFCRYMWFSGDMRYCDSCQSSHNCFGCTGLRHKKYCILNKQYTKEEYEALLPQIIAHMKETGEWGQYWPLHYLPFSYNESGAQDFFPLEQSEATQRGFLWRAIEEQTPDVEKIIPADQLPDRIADVPDDVLHWAIRCSETDRPFRIMRRELELYRQYGLPLPRHHPERRHRKRMAMRNPMHLWKRTCGKCESTMVSSYAPERPETVYCESCFQREVY